MLRRTLIVGGILALMVGPVAMAQQTTQPVPPAQAGAIAATMQLRQNAFRLTILNSLPEEARAEATALMDRKQALQTAEQELELARLQAYVTALEAGESPNVAQDLATGKVAAQSADVTREREALRTDAEAFGKAHPEVRGTMMQLGPLGHEGGAMFGAGEFGRNAGPMFGEGASQMFGEGAGPMFGAGEFGMHRRDMRPGGPEGMNLPECMKDFTPPARNFQHR